MAIFSFKAHKELEETQAALTKEFAKAQTDHKAALDALAAEHTTAIQNLQATYDGLAAELETVKQDRDAKAAELVAQVAKFDELTQAAATAAVKYADIEKEIQERVAAKALSLTQAQGIPPLDVPQTDTPTQPEGVSMAEQFRAIPDAKARAEFWTKHKDAILS